MIAYTIVSRAFVAHARVLARSFASHHPGQTLWVLLIDDETGEITEENEPFNVLYLTDLDLEQEEFHRMAMLFGDKIIRAIKPWVFEYFLSRNTDQVLFIDSHFMVFNDLSEVVTGSGSGVILVPNVMRPIPSDGMYPDDTAILGAGMFNAGMFGTGPDHGGFIDFLKDRLRRECISDVQHMRFNEQRWLDFVPALFPYHVIRDPGVDVGYWNLHERPLARAGEGWTAGGTPLRAFHFSSFDPRMTGVGGRYELSPSPRVIAANNPDFSALCDEYRSALFAAGFHTESDRPFAFDTLADGRPVYASVRALYADAVESADAGCEPYPPDAFDSAASSAFMAWARRAFAETRVTLPNRMSESPDKSSMEAGRARPRPGRGLFTRKRLRPATDVWSVDWLGRMTIDDAGESHRTHISILPARDGLVCHGPGQPLTSGTYRVTFEVEAQGQSPLAMPDDHALILEAFVQGDIVGHRTVTFAEMDAGTIVLDVLIPSCFEQAALAFGLEVQVLSRGRVDGRLGAIVFEALNASTNA